MEAVVYRVGDSARIFFISFYAVSVLIVFSVCTAFVVEAYMDMHEAKVQANLKGKAAAVATQLESLSMPTPISLATGAANAANGSGVRGDLIRSVPGSVDSTGSFRSTNASAAAFAAQSSKRFRQFAQAVHQKSHGPIQQIAPRQPSANAPARATSRSVACAAEPQSPSSRPLSPPTRPSLSTSPPPLVPAAVSGVSLESLLLSRIRDRASSTGLTVKLQPHRGMLHTLSRVFGAEEEDIEDDEEQQDTIVEEGPDDEKADE